MTQALVNYTVPDMERMALAFAASKLFGVSNAEQALALCLIAQAEGRHPASAAQDYHIINNKPSKKADAMLRDFIANGGKVEWHTLDDTIADATFSHPSGGSVRISWDHARAVKAGIANPMWKKYPRQMLRARVVSEGVRTVFPMATSGMYVPEEVQEFEPQKPANGEAAPIIEGEFTEAPARKSSAQAKRDGDWETIRGELDRCETLEQFNMLVASTRFEQAVAPLPPQWKQQVKDYVETARAEFAVPADEEEPPAPVSPASNLDAIEAGALT